MKFPPPLSPRAENLISKFQALHILKYRRKNAARPLSCAVINLDSRARGALEFRSCMCAPRSNCCSLRNAVAEHSHSIIKIGPTKQIQGQCTCLPTLALQISDSVAPLSGGYRELSSLFLRTGRLRSIMCDSHNEICTAEKQHNEISSMRAAESKEANATDPGVGTQ